MKNKRKNINKKYKIVFTDYYFEDINKEIEILNRLGIVILLFVIILQKLRIRRKKDYLY